MKGFVGCLESILQGFRLEVLAEIAGAEPRRIGELDRAALKVAMGVAALDGQVTAAELVMFEQLAGKCRGANEESVAKAFEEGLRFAGYLELQARRLEKDALLKLFTDEVFRQLPPAFFRSDMENVRRALAMWVMIAMSDDYFSGIERQAILVLRERIESAVTAADQAAVPFSASSIGLMAGSSPLGQVTHQVPSAQFVQQLEGVVSRMKQDATAVQAETELEQLIKG